MPPNRTRSANTCATLAMGLNQLRISDFGLRDPMQLIRNPQSEIRNQQLTPGRAGGFPSWTANSSSKQLPALRRESLAETSSSRLPRNKQHWRRLEGQLQPSLCYPAQSRPSPAAFVAAGAKSVRNTKRFAHPPPTPIVLPCEIKLKRSWSLALNALTKS